METSDFLFLCLTLTFPVVSSQSISTPPSAQYKHPGETITLECDITGALVGTGYAWTKRQDPVLSGQYVTIINTATAAAGFTRYSAAITEGGAKYRLTINSLAEEDSGHYRCEIHGTSGGVAASVEHSLSVLTDIDSVFLDGAADSAQYNRSSSSKTALNYVVGSGTGYFVCEVTGGYPRPQVKVMVGGDSGRNVASTLQRYEDIQFIGAIAGLQKIKFVQRYSSSIFDLLATDDGHNIVCKAQVKDQDTTVTYSAEQSAMLNLSYRPEVILNRDYTADIGDTNVQIAVELMANPIISSASWTAMSSGDVIANGETKNGMTAILKTKDAAYAFILAIDMVKLVNFQMYQVSLGNDYGIRSDTVTLLKGPRDDYGGVNNTGVTATRAFSTIYTTEELTATTPSSQGRKLSIFKLFIVVQISVGLFVQLGC